jgi:uncharacterized protein YqfA (UPF0365 family)
MDSSIIIGLLGLFIGIVISTIYLFPTLLTKWRASELGLNLSYGQARIVTKDYCNKKDFLETVKEIWFWADIPIHKLTSHYNAKGDLKNLRDGIIEMKHKNRDIDFSLLSAFDLAGRDLKEEIRKAEMKNWTFDLATD